MRKNYYNDNVLMIKLRELKTFIKTYDGIDIEGKSSVIKIVKDIKDKYSKIDNDFRVAILADSTSIVCKYIIKVLKNDFFNIDEFITPEDINKALASLTEEDDLYYLLSELNEKNILGFKGDLIKLYRPEFKRIDEALDYVLMIKDTKCNLEMDSVINCYDGKHFSKLSSQDRRIFGIKIPKNGVNKIYLDEYGRAAIYFNLDGLVVETEFVSTLPRKEDKEIYVGKMLGLTYKEAKQYLDDKCYYDNTELDNYMLSQEKNKKIYKLI